MSKVRATLGWVMRRASFTSRLKRGEIFRSHLAEADDLERHDLVELLVGDTIDGTHAATPEALVDPITPSQRAPGAEPLGHVRRETTTGIVARRARGNYPSVSSRSWDSRRRTALAMSSA